MKMSISVYGAHLLLPETERKVGRIIAKAAGLGFDGIDLGYYWGEDRRSEFAEAVKIADSEGIAIANYVIGNNFGAAAAEGKAKLDAEIAKVKTALDEAAFFQCRALRVFAGGYGLEWSEYSGKIAEALAACVDHAKGCNVVMALEDHGGLCKNSPEMLYYLTAVNSPALRVTADIGNFWFPGGELPENGVRAVAKYAAMVHVKDYIFVNNQELAVPVGEGMINFRECFRLLHDANYQGWLSLEYECLHGEPRQGIATSLVHMRKFAAGF